VTTRIDPVNNIGKTAMKIAEEMKAGITSDNRGLLKLFINNSDKDSIEIERGVKIEIPDGTQFRIRYDKNKKALDVIKINDYGASEEITVNPSSCNQVFIK
jgi:hypothetical protein